MIRMFPALFLDRDGVIIENRPAYVRSWSDVEIFPQALEALAKISSSRYKIILITNQSGIGRGLIDRDVADQINRRLIEIIRQHGGRIDAVYLCPHRPDEDCDCRKPRPGMVLQAAQDHDIDLSRSILIGDAISDLMAGAAAGVGKIALVLTGRGRVQAQYVPPEGLPPFPIYDALTDALQDFIPTS